MKLLIDMNLWPGWVQFLARSGIEAEHWSSIGHASAGDTEIAVYAREHGFVILTQDTEFGTSWRSPKKRSRASFKSGPMTPLRKR